MNKNVNIVTTMEIVSTLIIGLCSVYQLLNCPMKGTSTNFVEATTCKICVTIKIIAAKYMGFCSRITNVLDAESSKKAINLQKM